MLPWCAELPRRLTVNSQNPNFNSSTFVKNDTPVGTPTVDCHLIRPRPQASQRTLLPQVYAVEEGLEAGALRGRSLALDCDGLHFEVAAEEQRP